MKIIEKPMKIIEKQWKSMEIIDRINKNQCEIIEKSYFQ